MILADDISLTIGTRALLDHITLAIKPACFTALLGNNGAGKSTLISVLSGERKPSRGSVSYDDRPIAGLTPRTLAQQRAVMLQSTKLDFPMRVADVVALGRLPYIGTSEALNDACAIAHSRDAAQIKPLWQQPFTTLSGGEAQRVQFARALAQVWSPAPSAPSRFLFLDEPTSAMDLRQRRHVLQAVRDLTRSGMGVIAILHDLNLAMQYADEVILLRAGRLLAHGAVDAVMTAPHLSDCFETPVEILTRSDQSSLVLV